MKQPYRITFVNEQRKEHTPKELKDLLKTVICATLESEETPPCEVTVLLTDNAKIHKLNLEFRDVDRPTDVLSFPSGEEYDGETPFYLGDIALSLEKTRAQAEEYGHSYEREAGFLVAHSALHLLGYDHENGETEMFEKQESVLQSLHLTR